MPMGAPFVLPLPAPVNAAITTFLHLGGERSGTTPRPNLKVPSKMNSTPTAEPQPEITRRRAFTILLVIWLIVAIAKTATAIPDLIDRTFPDPDDAMRLLQVRDWLAGQSWWDITQYRLNPPFGGPMHWSRYIDLPIAGVELLFRPLVGQYNAETAALVIVPMLTLGAAMLLVFRITERLANTRAAILSAVGAPASIGAMIQMKSMRIDHHGWQIVLALAVVLAALDARQRRSGIVAGACLGLWLNVSIEALPFAAATGALFGLQWLVQPNASERLRVFLMSLAGSAALLFAATHLPSTWTPIRRDALNIGDLGAFAAAAAVAFALVGARVADVRQRIVVLGIIGAAAVGVIYSVDRHFWQSPFATLDPLVARLWYAAVDEGQPIWHLGGKDMAVALAQQAVGLAGVALAIWKTSGAERRLWWTYGFMLGVSTIMSIAVTREATLAGMLAIPATAFACDFALVRARAVPHMSKRVLATAGALCIMGPAYAVPAATMPKDPGGGQPDYGAQCARQKEVTHLNALPPSILAAPLDITPAILAETRHTAIGSGHHRNVSGIKDMILLFVGPEAGQHEVIRRRKIDYVVFCPGTAEAGWWAKNGPRGLAASLSHGKAPQWLQPVNVPGLHYIRVWRVDKASSAVAKP